MTLTEALAWADKNTQPEAVERLRSRAVAKVLADEVRSLQAKIDELMPEHCPEEMTPEQMAEYERHQVSVPDHGFTPMRKHLDWVIKKKKKA